MLVVAARIGSKDAFLWIGLGLQVMSLAAVLRGIWSTYKEFRDFRKDIPRWLLGNTTLTPGTGRFVIRNPPTLENLNRGLTALERTVQQESERLNSLVEKVATSSLDLSAAGVVLLFVGVVMSALPELLGWR